mmetsp:Transcript_10211/g.13842  ORF Transcript_10211/g.13842 Transcript_10211/m.13842 type:complete len:98 (-) Transcript_10211:92-385(-)
MDLTVINHVAKCTLVASLALFRVYSEVLGEVGLLGEALAAVGLATDEGALAGVHAQVVEEVVPLAEEHAALLMVALQNFHLPHSSRILVLENAELSS